LGLIDLDEMEVTGMNQTDLNRWEPANARPEVAKAKWLLRALMASSIFLSIPGSALAQEASRRPVAAEAEVQSSPSDAAGLPLSSALQVRSNSGLSDRTFWVPAGWQASRYTSGTRFSVATTGGLPPPPGRSKKPVVPDNDLAAKKFKYGLTETFLSWQGYLTTGLGAAITEAREKEQPQKTTADRAADGLSRYAIDFATRATKTFLGNGIYPIIFKQSPCYKRSRLPDVPSRILHAVIRVFVTETDNGGLTVNVSRLAGDMTAAAVANVYERNTPGFTRIGLAPTFTRFGTMIGTDALSLAVKEFTPDIKKLLHIQ
jgi:hypothetical protein